MNLFCKIAGVDEKEFQSIDDLPMINSNKVIILAMLIQNALHPKNSHRSEAIEAGTYVEIKTEEDATKFLSEIVQKHLKNELLSIEG